MSALASALLLLSHPATVAASSPPQLPCDKPVVMVITGVTHDRARMLAYAHAIADSKLYERLGGYYLNIPRSLARLEGEAPPGHTTLMVRFPCLENAQAFWNSRTYQEDILPLRRNPSAGDYVVDVYPEAPLRDDLVGDVGENAYRTNFPAEKIVQVSE